MTAAKGPGGLHVQPNRLAQENLPNTLRGLALPASRATRPGRGTAAIAVLAALAGSTAIVLVWHPG